jgi:hypothetical protein
MIGAKLYLFKIGLGALFRSGLEGRFEKSMFLNDGIDSMGTPTGLFLASFSAAGFYIYIYFCSVDISSRAVCVKIPELSILRTDSGF